MLQETPLRSVAAGVPGESKRPHAARPFLFLSDLHLSEALPRTVAAFEHFIRVTAGHADSVFILGDLFEYWIGDDMLADPFAARMAALMHTLSETRHRALCDARQPRLPAGQALHESGRRDLAARSIRDHVVRHPHRARAR